MLSPPRPPPGGWGDRSPPAPLRQCCQQRACHGVRHAGCAHGTGLVIGCSCPHHTAPNIADGRQQGSVEGENPASSTYVTNDFLSPPQEQGLRLFFFSPFFKKLGVVNKGTEPSASFPHQEGICSRKGGHFDKSCELRWVPGNFLAHLGLPELLPQRAASSPPGPRESVSPSTEAAARAAGRRVGGTWTGAASLPVLLPSPPAGDSRSSPLPLAEAPRRLDAMCEGPRGSWGVFLLGGARTSG